MENENETTVNTLLASANTRLQSRLNLLEARYISHTTLENILGCLEQHYDTEMKKRAEAGTTTLPLTDTFYVNDKTGITMLDSSFTRSIESLWLGRIEKKQVTHNGKLKCLMLHPHQLNDDRPLPVLVDSTGALQGIVVRHPHRNHSFLCKHDPSFPGLVFAKDKANEWLSLPNFRAAQGTSLWPECAVLERLSSMWLGRAPRDPSLSTLLVDSDLVRSFVQALKENENARCHFTISGQTTLHAYICLTAADKDQTDIYKLPIGTIA